MQKSLKYTIYTIIEKRPKKQRYVDLSGRGVNGKPLRHSWKCQNTLKRELITLVEKIDVFSAEKYGGIRCQLKHFQR